MAANIDSSHMRLEIRTRIIVCIEALTQSRLRWMKRLWRIRRNAQLRKSHVLPFGQQTETMSLMKRKQNVDNDGKPKKRRYYERKNMRRTNTHLDGTEIGAMLARAAEKQARGGQVGDGGM